ncbi:MAG: alpha/beta hydrolase [Chloroflexi bacterium]|nr:alpha/beta hydrolase [Chloroflexota bacterium]
MATWSTGSVTANGICIAYHRTGGSGPPLVLAHGITDHGLCWGPVARALEGDYDVIMVDARGHGETEAPEHGYTWDILREDLAAFIREMGLERPHLMGHSMGAETAAQVAAHYPELVRRIVLEDPPWREGAESEAERTASGERFRASILARCGRTQEELIARCRAESPTWPEDELAPWAEAKIMVSPRVAEIAASHHAPWRETARRIRVPALLVTGEPGKAIVTPEVAREAVGLMAQGEELHVPGVGHCIHREQFDAVIEGVRRFLGRT